jgi:hypothetical protein
MIVIYALPILVYAGLWDQAGAPKSAYHLAMLGAFVFHFAKRIVESLWVHRYSRETPAGAFVNIAVGYSAMAASLSYFQNRAPGGDELSTMFFRGLALFVVGEALNGYHHVLLRGLRKPGSSRYILPRGGLFRWIACPHYLGEILAFVGYAIMGGLLIGWGIVAVVVVYLVARSRSTVAWYQQKLGPLPSSWKGIVPFFF